MLGEKTAFDDLVALIGSAGALNLCEQYGGQTLYIRKDGVLPDGLADHWSTHFGPEAYGKIVERMGGQRVYIPVAPKEALDNRNEIIYHLRRAGVPTAKIASDVRLTPRAVHGIVSRFAQRQEPATNQAQGENHAD